MIIDKYSSISINILGSAISHQQSNKDINTPFIHGEGGGATKPSEFH